MASAFRCSQSVRCSQHAFHLLQRPDTALNIYYNWSDKRKCHYMEMAGVASSGSRPSTFAAVAAASESAAAANCVQAH